MDFRVFGGLVVTDGDKTLDLATPKQRAVLAILLLERDRVVSVDRLVDLLWGDESDKALSSLQAYISRLRATLEPQRRPRDPAMVLVSQSPGYRLVIARTDVDLFRFEDTVERGLQQLREGTPEQAVTTLEAAVRLWTGPVLPEFAVEPFVVAVANRANGVRLSAVEALAQMRLESGDHVAAASILNSEAGENPTRERLHTLLALALYRGGRQTEALSVVDQCRRSLRDGAGLDPGPELRRLESDLLNQSPSLDWTPTGRELTPANSNPAGSASVVLGAQPKVTRREASRVRSNLIGRTYEVDVLTRAFEQAVERGGGGVALIIGEPGIGKTRLAESIVDDAKDRGIAYAWARFPESRSAPPFWAWTQLDDQLRHVGVDLEIVSHLGRASSVESDGRERFATYRTIIESIAQAGRPLLLVLDDLQWADLDSLRVLEHFAAELSATQVFFVATLRPLDEESPPALVDCLAEVARVGGGVQLELTGLGVGDVERWLSGRADSAVPASIAQLVHERTGGNPLFIKEITELLASEGHRDDEAAAKAANAIPAGVQFVVRRRVSRLPAGTQRVLSVSAVVGQSFDLESLSAAVGINQLEVLDALGPALEAKLIVERGAEFAFSHALVADALASEVNAARRAAIHAAVARALATRAAPGFGTNAATIAHHAVQGILAGTGDLAIDAGSAAASLSTRRFAYEDAAAHWGTVALALAQCRPSDVGSRVDALIEQAAALLRVEMLGEAREAILLAIEEADAAGLVEHMTRAASLLNHSRVWANEEYGFVDTKAVAAIERTIALNVNCDPKTRAMLLGALPLELVFADRNRQLAASDAAINAARGAGNPAILAQVLNNTMVPNRPDLFEARRERANEVLALAKDHELPEHLVFAAHFHLSECFIEIADMRGASRELALASATIASIPGARVSQQYWVAATIAIATGRYEEARTLVARAYEDHRRGRNSDADVLLATSRFAMALDLGGFEAEGFFTSIVAAAPQRNGYRRPLGEAMAFAALEFGQSDLAAKIAKRFPPDAGYPDDYTTLFCATAALHVRVELGDHDGAASAARVLAGYESRWAGAGTASLSMGVVGLALARYSGLIGRADDARTQFESAIDTARNAGTPAWLARTLVHYGAFLNANGESAVAKEILAEARDLATLHGFAYVLRRLDNRPV